MWRTTDIGNLLADGRPPVDLTNPRVAAERAWVRAFARWAKGDPNLSVEEARFLADVAYMSQSTDPLNDRTLLSRREAWALRALADRLGYAFNAPIRQPPEDDC